MSPQREARIRALLPADDLAEIDALIDMFPDDVDARLRVFNSRHGRPVGQIVAVEWPNGAGNRRLIQMTPPVQLTDSRRDLLCLRRAAAEATIPVT